MLRLYRTNNQLAQIRDQFKTQFPERSALFTTNSLRSMFIKLIRMAVRRLTHEVWKSGRRDLPPLVKLDDQLVKNLINSADCLEIRWLLIDIYQSANPCNRELLVKTIFEINEYALRGGAVRKTDALSLQFPATRK